MLRRTTFFSTAMAVPRGVAAIGGLLLAFGFGCGGSSAELPSDPGIDAGGVDSGALDTSPAGCPTGQTTCGDTCTNTKFDPANCGACGTACKTGEVCNGGSCSATGCTAPFLECGGKCVDPSTDEANCGKCGVACVGGELCAGDKGCVLTCPGALTACTKACVDTANDPTNCGACGTACATGEVCVSGKCAATCAAPLKVCGTACTNTDYDPNNCGACGTKCTTGVACVGGACGTPDKTDDDGDGISNFHEGKSSAVDTDADMKADYLDDDSDGDGILDKDEAGDTNVVTPPIDTDGDGRPDFQDTDSDNDGITDKDEATKYKTSPIKADTDGDGYTDFEEIAAGTDPLLATSNPGAIGGFSFDLPYKGTPRSQDLVFKPSIKKADLGWVIDTTGSMGGTISGLKTSLKSIITKVSAKVPDVAVAVGDHRDFPVAGYGSTGDFPFKLWQRVTTDITLAQAGVDKLAAAGGSDGPESQIEGIFQMAKGDGFRSLAGATWTPKFDATVGYDATKGHGKIGGAGFRDLSAPIIILATDISFHHKWGDTENPNATAGLDAYVATNFGTAADQMPKTVAETVKALTDIGAKFIGVAVEPTTVTGKSSQRLQSEYFAMKTGAFTPTADAAGKCATGVAGALVDAVADPADATKKVCPLVFGTASTPGTAFETAVVDAITKLTTYVTFKTINLKAVDNAATTTIDETKFFVRGVPVSYAFPLPAGCASSPTIADLLPTGGDGVVDSFTNVCPSLSVTFSLVLKNDAVPATCTDQVFSFKVVVVGDSTVETDSRIVTVRIPGDKTLCK